MQSGLELTNIGNDSIPTLDAAPTTQTWATHGKLYFYRTTDAYSNPLTYLCVVSPFYPTVIELCLMFFAADEGVTLNSGNVSAWTDNNSRFSPIATQSDILHQPVYHSSDTIMNNKPCIYFQNSVLSMPTTPGLYCTICMVLYSFTNTYPNWTCSNQHTVLLKTVH